MKTLSIVLFLMLMAFKPVDDHYLVIQGKSIIVDGNTNIGRFSCGYMSEQNDTLFFNKLNQNPYAFTLIVPEFECGKFFLNRDFRHTLKAEQYPEIVVRVLDLEPTGQKTLKGKIKLHLAGRTKMMDNIEFNVVNHQRGQSLNACFMISASEFNLTPPNKLGGLIKADDEINITVELLYQ